LAISQFGGDILKNGNKKPPPPEEGKLVPKESEPTETDREIDEFVREAPPEFRKLLEKEPAEIRKTIMSFMMRTSMGGALPHPLFDKFTPQHVDKFLDLNEKDNERSFNFAGRGRWFQLVYVPITLTFLVFIIVYLLPDHKDLVISLITILTAIAGGFGMGYGYKARK